MRYSVISPILRGCLVMAHISGEDRSQVLLLPDAVEDYVEPDNPVRFIDAFVDSLDLEASGFGRVRPRETGRPGYDPADLLKLYIYGYLNRVRSSRRLEQGSFLTRRLDNVRGEFSLTTLAYNLRRAINLVGVPAMMAIATG